MKLTGSIKLPGDKSLTHRAIMFNSISEGTAVIKNPLLAADTLATLNIFKSLGVKIEQLHHQLIIHGQGWQGLKTPNDPLDCQNSGTTARLLLGLLSGIPWQYPIQLIGDASLSKRPMKRVVKHLQPFLAQISLTMDQYLPAIIHPCTLKAGKVALDVPSAQVKSACLLASLKSPETSIIKENQLTRNHTELMLKYLGCDLTVDGLTIQISGKNPLIARDFIVPGDISSAAFFIVAALIVPNSEITLCGCGINPTRTGILEVLDAIGADYEILNRQEYGFEPVGDLHIRYTPNLKPFAITETMIPRLVDEIPILALLATQIAGVSTISGASELRIKESDRLKATTVELSKLGAKMTETADGLIIQGKTALRANACDAHHDHRLSMMLQVARLIAGDFAILGEDCYQISYPNFPKDLAKLITPSM